MDTFRCLDLYIFDIGNIIKKTEKAGWNGVQINEADFFSGG